MLTITIDLLHLTLFIGFCITTGLYLHEQKSHQRTMESMTNFLEANGLIVYEEEEE